MFQERYGSSAAAAASTRTADCSTVPTCPVCGGLECLCRPRFFAGQILTEDDLNRLQQYVIAKNRLHNRYLHGWGVVCGLEVLCHPCKDRLIVRAGYALSPCGDDIVLCQDAPVDACALIQQCRQVERSYAECLPPRPIGDDDPCREVTEEWILAVCYDEKPSRGITALKGSSSAAGCSGCACGGSSACACGCHSGGTKQTNGNGYAAATAARRNPPPQCEPTLICEGYRFIAYKAPPKDAPTDRLNLSGLLRRLGFTRQRELVDLQIGGEMGRRYNACASLFLDLWSTPPATDDRERRHTWCCEIKEALLDFFERHPTGDCGLYGRVLAIPCPSINDEEFESKITQARDEIVQIGGEYLHHCLCSALLPPCPDPVAANCVPLATLKVRKNPCEVLEVCNWKARRLVVTFPLLGYWVSPFQLLERLREFVVTFCCTRSRRILRREGIAAPGGAAPPPGAAPEGPPAAPAGPTAGTGDTDTPSAGSALAALLSEAWRRKPRALNGQSWILAALQVKDPQGQSFASDLDLALPVQSLLLNQIIKPTVDDILPTELSRRPETGSGGGPTPAGGEQPAPEGGDLRARVAELQRVVEAQGAEIERLKTRRGR